MFEGPRPILKKVKHINYNNPSLNSVGIQGAFYSANPPPVIRDELVYQSRFKDSLEREIHEVERFKRMEKNQGSEHYQMERSNSGPPKTEIQAMRYRGNTLPVKITQNNFEDALSQRVNFDHRAIRTKQFHGYNIISNT